ncbi:MAG: hypothetical protein K940chlam2_00709 [Chlamydiae bacterium]|nr:hypothetical protein [Chlamydiota bacterium]
MEDMTNESLRGICANNFELAHFAIRLSRYHMKAGHEVTMQEVLDEVRKNPDPSYIEKLIEMESFDTEEEPVISG